MPDLQFFPGIEGVKQVIVNLRPKIQEVNSDDLPVDLSFVAHNTKTLCNENCTEVAFELTWKNPESVSNIAGYNIRKEGSDDIIAYIPLVTDADFTYSYVVFAEMKNETFFLTTVFLDSSESNLIVGLDAAFKCHKNQCPFIEENPSSNVILTCYETPVGSIEGAKSTINENLLTLKPGTEIPKDTIVTPVQGELNELNRFRINKNGPQVVDVRLDTLTHSEVINFQVTQNGMIVAEKQDTLIRIILLFLCSRKGDIIQFPYQNSVQVFDFTPDSSVIFCDQCYNR